MSMQFLCIILFLFKDVSGTVQELWEQENIGIVQTIDKEVFVDETDLHQLESKVDTLGSMDETSETQQLESNVDTLGSIDELSSRCSSREFYKVPGWI